MAGGSVAFTASRAGFAPVPGVVINVLTVHVPHAARYVTGGCRGGDAFIGQWLHANRPAAGHVIIVPANRAAVDEWWLDADRTNITVIEMPEGTTYAHRNARLVAEGDCVFGFPAYPEADRRSRRSGTWQAIRMARRAGKLSQWHCVTPPYRGWIEIPARRILAGQGPYERKGKGTTVDNGVEVFVEVPGKARWTLGKVPLDMLHLVVPQVTALGVEGAAGSQLLGRLVLPAAEPGMMPAGKPPAAIYLVTVTPAAPEPGPAAETISVLTRDPPRRNRL